MGEAFAAGSRRVREEDLASFTRLTGDRHPIHVDAHWAADSSFGELVAPGMLVLSYAVGLLRLDPEHAIAMTGLADAVFVRPVKVGDTITVTGRISSRVPGADGSSIVTITLLTLNQRQQATCRVRLKIKWRDKERSEWSAHGSEGAAG